MTGPTSQTVRPKIAVEDTLLAALGLLSGPLLWWMGQTWQHNPAASSIQTLEYWIALVCGFVGLSLCVLWAIYVIAGLSLVLGLKTHNKLITYWSELFTPKFLRRIIISLFGAQLALTSQAFAAPSEQETHHIGTVDQHEPFMPYVHDPSVIEPELPNTSTVEQHSPSASPTESPSNSEKTKPSLASEPRQFSEVTVTPQPTAEAKNSDELVPTPRQTSTMTIEQEAGEPSNANREALDQEQTYLPQQPVPSPYIAAPNQARNTEDPTVVVTTGDCLWDIAHQELGADATLFQIDQRWRQWWNYNQEIIGDDPHSLLAGTALQAPPFTD